MEIIAIIKHMKAKLKFVTPRVTQMVELSPEVDLLQAGSVAEKTMFITAGQGVKDYEFQENADSGYSYYWEED